MISLLGRALSLVFPFLEPVFSCPVLTLVPEFLQWLMVLVVPFVPLPGKVRRYPVVLLGGETRRDTADQPTKGSLRGLAASLPSVAGGFSPKRYILRNNFVQGCLIILQNFHRKQPPLRLSHVRLRDGDRVPLYEAHPTYTAGGALPEHEWRGIVLIVGGVAGEEHDPHVTAQIELLLERGFATYFTAPRGMCAPIERAPANWATTGDLAEVVLHLRRKHAICERAPSEASGELPEGLANDSSTAASPSASSAASGKTMRLYVTAFSLGASNLSKLLAEPHLAGGGSAAERCIAGACCISNPFDVNESVTSLDNPTGLTTRVSGFLIRRKYQQKYFREPAQLYRDRKVVDEGTLQLADKLNSIRECDALLSCQLADVHSTEKYYKQASSQKTMKLVKVPTLCLNALNDPLVSRVTLLETIARTVSVSDRVVFAVTEVGGHNVFSETFSYQPSTNFQARIAVEWIEALHSQWLTN